VAITKIVSNIMKQNDRKLLKIGHDLLYWAWTDKTLVYIVYTFR
jgi:hypothetical protein